MYSGSTTVAALEEREKEVTERAVVARKWVVHQMEMVRANLQRKYLESRAAIDYNFFCGDFKVRARAGDRVRLEG